MLATAPENARPAPSPPCTAADVLGVDHKTVGSFLQMEVPPHIDELLADALGVVGHLAELGALLRRQRIK